MASQVPCAMISARWRPCRCPEVAKLCWTTCEAVSLTLGFCQLFPVGVTREIPSAPSHLLMPCEEILLPPTEQAQAQSSQLLPSYCITRCKLGDLGILQRMMYIGFFSPPCDTIWESFLTCMRKYSGLASRSREKPKSVRFELPCFNV